MRHSHLIKQALIANLLAGSLLLIGCDYFKPDPMMQTIPTNADRWQDKLGDTLDDLKEEDRQLLSRYMLRMRLSEAYKKGAMPRITVGKAIELQRKYEALHPDNPTGRQSPVTGQATNGIQQLTYPLLLLPVTTSEQDSLNQVELSFVFSNRGELPITSFEGTILMRYPTFKKAKPVVIEHTEFNPPIASKTSRKLVADVSIADTNVMKAIHSPQDIELTISEGVITLEDGSQVVFN
ncbi:hypothetical protein [Psychrobacter lutiphocae]|uniref:hypothetical protein n=1 Tax=Psychrobacter lutiphocae TaxID=540500 RepID=UPI0003668DCA|nr:hypothetical protein [Psychrobacter lutiphocae]